MTKLGYQKIKGLLANPNMFHVLYIFMITVFFGCFFRIIDTADNSLTIIGSGILGLFVGIAIESLDGRQGTKQYDETGVEGNSFSMKDLLYDAIGAVLAMVSIGILVL